MGTPGYTYTWSPGNQTSASLINQCAGVYTLTAEDANGCVAVATATLDNPADLTLATSSTDPKCFGSCDGSAMAMAGGGTPNYSYAWLPTGGGTSSETNLCDGTYTVTVTDNNGCAKTATLTLAAPPALTITASSTPVNCAASCDGTATATVTGGVPGYFYTWSAHSNTNHPNSQWLMCGQLCGGYYGCQWVYCFVHSGRERANCFKPPP